MSNDAWKKTALLLGRMPRLIASSPNELLAAETPSLASDHAKERLRVISCGAIASKRLNSSTITSR